MERGFRGWNGFFLITAMEILLLKSMIGAQRLLPRIARMIVESASSMKPVLTTDSTDGTDSVAVLFYRENYERS